MLFASFNLCYSNSYSVLIIIEFVRCTNDIFFYASSLGLFAGYLENWVDFCYIKFSFGLLWTDEDWLDMNLLTATSSKSYYFGVALLFDDKTDWIFDFYGIFGN